MLTSDFQNILTFLFLVLISGLITYATFCNRKSKSYSGTGRVAEIEAWHMKATVTWILTFGITVVGIINFI